MRPLKVLFQSREEAQQILKNKNKLAHTDKYLKYDQTKSQREYLKSVLEELEARKASGETGLKIKYVNSIPRIIKMREPKNLNVIQSRLQNI